MPVRRVKLGDRIEDSERLRSLQRQLEAEWSGAETPEPRPDITEEIDRQSRVLRVRVVWDAWSDVPADVQSEMIVRALRQKHGEDAVLHLSIALGLTIREAKSAGLASNE